MSNYNQLTEEQKKTLMSLVKLILSLVGDMYYRTTMEADSIRIRPRISNPPNASIQNKFQKYLLKLSEINLIAFEKAPIPVFIGQFPLTRVTSVESIKINYLNIDLLNRLLSDVGRVDGLTIPPIIQLRWYRFNSEMHVHIKNCLKENLEEKYNNLLTTQILGNTFRSPIGLTAPTIPVRLPNELLPDNKSNEVYDLVEILNIRERNPSDPSQRCNPITRKYFSLNEIIPAPEALEELKKRIATTQEPSNPTLKPNYCSIS